MLPYDTDPTPARYDPTMVRGASPPTDDPGRRERRLRHGWPAMLGIVGALALALAPVAGEGKPRVSRNWLLAYCCLLYTSDAADE